MEFFFNGQWKQEYSYKIIRPYRSNHYSDSDLGPSQQSIGNQLIHRRDFQINNQYHQKLICTLYRQQDQQHHCIIYLHGNSGSRFEGIKCLEPATRYGCSLCTFDFSGSGQSDGEYVTLGIQESQDLKYVITYLKELGYMSFTLWGRSMGATTALYYQSLFNDPSVTSMIIDSPYSNLRNVCNDQAEEKTCLIPSFIFDILITRLQKHIQSIIHCDPFSINVNQLVQNHTTPCLFVYSMQDQLIKPYHSEELMNKFAGRYKQLVLEGNHNEVRQDIYYDTAMKFIMDQKPTKILYNQHRSQQNQQQQALQQNMMMFKSSSTKFMYYQHQLPPMFNQSQIFQMRQSQFIQPPYSVRQSICIKFN